MNSPIQTDKIKNVQVRRQSSLSRKENTAAFLFLLPNLIGFFVFTVLAVLASLVLSFFNWDLITQPKFVGIQNYKQLFVGDPAFYHVLWNTVYFTIGTVPTSTILGLLIAVGLNQKIKGLSFFRTVYFMPTITSMVATSLLWEWIFDSNYGLINLVLRYIGIHNPPAWLSSTTWAMPAIIILSVWTHLGFNMVIFLAGLQGIPQHLYEAARIDGASTIRQFFAITLPLLSPTTLFVLVITMIGSFQVFTQAFVMTQGGPADATSTLVYYIYQNGFHWFKMGYASAVAWVLFAIVFLLTVLQVKLQKKWVHY